MITSARFKKGKPVEEFMDWHCDEETSLLFRHYSLQNSLEYDGEGKVGSVIGRIMAERPDLRQHGDVISGMLTEEVKAANDLAKTSGLDHLRSILESEAPHLLIKRSKERREGLPQLPNAIQGDVVLRFAPNPNGPLSFGHGRGVVINAEYAKLHDGELILRFDDTDTSKKPPLPDAYSQIAEEIEWLVGFAPHRIIFASDRIETYYQYAEKIIAEGGAYCCTCSGDEFKLFRQQKTECPCRERNESENITIWEQMLEANSIPGSAVVRIKTDMSLKNPALRDWPALRIQDTATHPHPRPEIGSKYRVWPLLDFQSAIEDHLQGVTHIIRGKDLMDSTRKQILLYEKFGWDYPETIYWGRVKIHEFGGFSTSGMRSAIEAGKWSGWDDPRLPTIATMRRKGIQSQALRDFWIELGLTQKDISVPLATLYSHNSKVIDSSSPRLSFVRDPVELELSHGSLPPKSIIELASHPSGQLGQRKIDITWRDASTPLIIERTDMESHDSGLRLKEWCDISSPSNGHSSILSLDSSGDCPIIHWLPTDSPPAILLKPEGNELKVISGNLEANLHPIGTIVQLERVGYARIEADDDVGRKVLIHLHD
jgi:glutamyl-tRNA synthetase